MSKRRINKQQASRIKKMQGAYHEAHQSNDPGSLLRGLIISRFGAKAIVETAKGARVVCSHRTHLEALVAGDEVLWLPEDPNQGSIVSVFPRKVVLERTNLRGEKKPIAANITQLIITIATTPQISWPLLDSYLIMAEALHIKATIVLNKVDLPCEDIKSRLMKEYQSIHYPVLCIQRGNAQNYKQLEEVLNHEVSVFVGQSGVGKSSLISAILPHEPNILVGAIAESSQLGRHTTSNSRYYHIPTGGALIDSPGVREFSLWNLNPTDIIHYYRECEPYITQCQFRNCNHRDSLGCAIVKAVETGDISQNRYANYLALHEAAKNQKPTIVK